MRKKTFDPLTNAYGGKLTATAETRRIGHVGKDNWLLGLCFAELFWSLQFPPETFPFGPLLRVGVLLVPPTANRSKEAIVLRIAVIWRRFKNSIMFLNI